MRLPDTDVLQRAWDSSYDRGENYLFYPNEEIIRFVSRYVRKQTGLQTFRALPPFGDSPRWLDLGCGVGRHVIYGHQIGCEVYGIDLSPHAVALARDWARRIDLPAPEQRLLVGDVSRLPWDAAFFDVVVSHGVVDSMPLETARQAIAEVARVLKRSGLFYCDLIAAPDGPSDADATGETIVAGTHESGTVQSYFNRARIRDLVDASFETLECVLVRRRNVDTNAETGRFHLILQPR